MKSVEYVIGYHCAPAIRGIKVANLVAMPSNMDGDLTSIMAEYNTKFNHKGLFFFQLCHCTERRLLLVFRKKMLQEYLRQPGVMQFLAQYGYEPHESLTAWLTRLKHRIEESRDFPHEIGVFLGYPLDDVKAFIRFRGNGYTLCGEWKVYGNRSSAMHAFHCFRMCRDYCHTQLIQGKKLEALVAETAC